jgi:hypothetical protein
MLVDRKHYSESRLKEIRGRIATLDSLKRLPDLCVYTTGSFGRLEASRYSDLDLFFVTATPESGPTRTQKTLLDSDLIRLGDELGFPPFSGDGEYLEVHTLKDMESHLGGPRDDFENFFTARLLLLLEGRPLANDQCCDTAIATVVRWYFRDFDDHQTDFKPVFLTNDIIRFWKTLCLNYENKRNTTAAAAKDKHRLRNLKLKFSRMLTCFSTLIAVAAEPNLTPEDVVALTHRTPWERLENVTTGNGAREDYEALVHQYEWFLEFTDKPSDEQVKELQNKAERDTAFKRAAEFGSCMHALLNRTVTTEVQRYLLV